MKIQKVKFDYRMDFGYMQTLITFLIIYARFKPISRVNARFRAEF